MQTIIILMYRPDYDEPTEFTVTETIKGLEFWIDRAVKMGFEPAYAEEQEDERFS